MRKVSLLALVAVAFAVLTAPASHGALLGPDIPRVTSPANAGGFGTLSLSATGFSEPGNTVKIVDGTPPCVPAGCGDLATGTLLGSTTVVGTPAVGDDDAAWTIPLTFATEGQKRIYVYSIYPSGQASAPAVVDFLLDPDAPGDPAVPVITSPLSGDTLTSRLVTVTGTAEPGADVVVSAAPPALRHATAAADGSWSVLFGLPNGPNSITAYQIDLAKNVSATSAPTNFTVSIDTTVPSAPVISSPVAGSIIGPNVTVSGIADPFSFVQIFEDRPSGFAIYGTVPADSVGAWSLSLRMLDGFHFLQARATGANGIKGAASAIDQFRVDATAPNVEITLPDLYLLAQVSTLHGSLVGTANDNIAVASVRLVYHDFLTGAVVADNLATCTGCPGPNVAWTDPSTVPVGLYSVSVVARDEVGNVSLPDQMTYLQLPI